MVQGGAANGNLFVKNTNASGIFDPTQVLVYVNAVRDFFFRASSTFEQTGLVVYDGKTYGMTGTDDFAVCFFLVFTHPFR